MRLTALLLTCERTEYALSTLRSFFKHAHYSDPLRLHIADDGSRPGHRAILHELGIRLVGAEALTISNSEGRGYGANYNAATQVVHPLTDVVLPLEDDWELTRPLDLDHLVHALTTAERFGCIRLGYIGFTQPLRGEVIFHEGQHYLLLDPESPEPHVWAGHPRLETVTWQRRVGPWQEGLEPGATEFEVAHRAEAREGVVWPLDLVKPYGDLFAHIGSVRAERQREEAMA